MVPLVSGCEVPFVGGGMRGLGEIVVFWVGGSVTTGIPTEYIAQNK